MEDTKALKLFQEIVSKTRAGRLRWEPTARDYEYFSILPGDFVVSVISRGEDRWGNETREPSATLRSGDQDLLTVTREVDGVGREGLEQLYELARRQALGVDAQVDRLLGDLAKL